METGLRQLLVKYLLKHVHIYVYIYARADKATKQTLRRLQMANEPGPKLAKIENLCKYPAFKTWQIYLTDYRDSIKEN